MANLLGLGIDGLKNLNLNASFIKQQFLDGLRLKFGRRFDAILMEFTKATTMENKMKIAGKYYSLYERDNPFERGYQKVKDKTNFKCKLDSEKLRKEGNVKYQKQELKEAHELYTKSIAYAPVDSDVLALAYANRSAVLRSMEKCSECLVDIERAFSHGYPRDKSFKLLLREMHCHRDMGNMVKAKESLDKANKLLESLSGITEEQKSNMKIQLQEDMQVLGKICTEEVIFPTEVPELSFGTSSEIVGASSAVRLEYTEQQGRHLVADRDINIGDVLLIAENLFVTLTDEFRYNHCTHCHNLCYNLIPCPNCVWVLFCSEKCLTEANHKYHNAECLAHSKYRHMTADSPTGTEQLFERAFRLIATIGVNNLKQYLKYARTNIFEESGTDEEKRTKGFTANGVFDPSNIETIFNLSTKIEEVHIDMLINSLSTFQAPRCLGMSMKHPDFYAVVGLYLQLQDIAFMNCYSKAYVNFNCEPKNYTKVAVSFNPLRSLLNHSCVFSNTMYVEYGSKHVVIAKLPIAKGSILTETYVHVNQDWPKALRQQYVKQECSFYCKCVPCEENWNFQNKSKILDPDDQKLASKIVSYNENILIDLYRCFSQTSIQLPLFDTYVKERRDFLTKMWKKGQFLDHRCLKMQYQLEVYYYLRGNHLISPIKYSQQILQDPSLVREIIKSIEMKYSSNY